MARHRLSDEDVQRRAAALPEWTASGGREMTRTYRFSGFAEAMRFVNIVAGAAEAANHHPDIDIRYDAVTLRLSTHDAGGLTDNDFELARRVDTLAAGL